MKVNKKTVMLVFALLVICALTGCVYAYSTTYVLSITRREIKLTMANTSVNTSFSGKEAHITIQNNGAYKEYIRIKVCTLSTVNITSTSSNVTLNNADGYYYYTGTVDKGSSTSEIVFTFSENEKTVFIVESTEALYDTNGNTYANWAKTIR